MSQSIVSHLVKKDFLIMRKTILHFCWVVVAGIVAISFLFGRVPNWVFVNLAFTFLIVPAFTCSIVMMMRTNVSEKEKSTQLFIMSLPVTVKEFTLAKLLVNLPLFFVFWMVGCAVAFYFAFGLGVFPKGTLPFITMIFLGVMLAYVCSFSVSLISQSLGITVLAMSLFELATPVYLWTIAYWEPIGSHVYAANMVWNSAAIGIVSTQILSVILVVFATWRIQLKKKDFI